MARIISITHLGMSANLVNSHARASAKIVLLSVSSSAPARAVQFPNDKDVFRIDGEMLTCFLSG
jgi:hypothetical protein